MKFIVDPQIFSDFEGLKIGIVIVKKINNKNNNPEITDLIRGAEKKIREIPNIEPVNDYPKINAWREAHRKFGNSPKKNPPSVQSIVRRVVKGGELPSINNLVDIYNYLSLKYIITAGGEDLDKCEGDIRLTYADGSEKFVELGSTENKPPEIGEVVYKDNKEVICRRFNWREGDHTKLTDDTKNAVLVLEKLPPVTDEELSNALEELRSLTEKYCDGEAKVIILDANNTETEL